MTLDADGSARADEGEAISFSGAWTPEHLVLTALARCIRASLRHHAVRASLEHSAEVAAHGTVWERDDGSWGFVELECAIDAALSPQPPPEELEAFLARTERGCFVGSSLRPSPTYRWRLNGTDVRS